MESLALGILTSLVTIIGTAVGVTWKIRERFDKEFSIIRDGLNHIEISLVGINHDSQNTKTEIKALKRDVRELQSYLQQSTDFKIRFDDKD